MLLNLLFESEEFINEPENAMTDKVHRDELTLLQEICDRDIALHSVELAVQVCCDLTNLERKCLDFSPEIIGNMIQWQTSLSEIQRGLASQGRLESLGQISDLEKAIALRRKVIIFTPLNDPYRPTRLTNLGSSYHYRYEWLGSRDDIDSAVRLHSRALALAPRDSTVRPKILLNLGNAYLRRLEQFEGREDFDFAIDQMLTKRLVLLQVHLIAQTERASSRS